MITIEIINKIVFINDKFFFLKYLVHFGYSLLQQRKLKRLVKRVDHFLGLYIKAWVDLW